MKKITFVFFLIFLFCNIGFSRTKELQFRLILKTDETKNIPHDKYWYSTGQSSTDRFVSSISGELLISKKIIISDSDIEKMSIDYDAFGRIFLTFHFTDTARKKFFEFAKENIGKQMAIISDGKLLLHPVIWNVVENGVTPVYETESFNAAVILIKSFGFCPYLEKGINNPDEEKNSYTFAKYAMEKNKQNIAEQIVQQLYEYNPKSDILQNLLLEHPALNNTVKMLAANSQLPEKNNIYFKLSCTAQDKNCSSVTVKSSDEKILVENRPVLTEVDIDSVYAIPENNLGWNISAKELRSIQSKDFHTFEILLCLTDDGQKKMTEITSKNVGKKMAVFINDELITVPAITKVISGGEVIIGGSFPGRRTKSLVEAIDKAIAKSNKK